MTPKRDRGREILAAVGAAVLACVPVAAAGGPVWMVIVAGVGTLLATLGGLEAAGQAPGVRRPRGRMRGGGMEP